MAVGLDTAMQAVLHGPQDDPLVEVDGAWFSRGRIAAIAESMNAALADAGIDADAPIGLVARNRLPVVAALFGLLARRRTVMMLHAYQAAATLGDDLRKLRLAAIVGDAEDMANPALGSAVREIGSLGIIVDDHGARRLQGAEKVGEGTRHAAQPGVAIFMLTSGTTGAPKRVPIGYAMLEAAIADAGLATAQAGTPFAAAAPFVQLYPLGNISGLYGLLTCAAAGQRIVLMEKFSVAGWVRAVESYRPASFVSLPPAAIRMVMEADVPQDTLSYMPAMRCGSAPLDPTLQAAFEARYGVPILITYGATEFGGVIAQWTLDDHRRFAATKRGSVGKPRPGTHLRIVDADSGDALPAGQQGILDVLSDRLGGDWVRTTDLGVIDEDGFLFLKGRADSVIIRGGFKVAPEAVAAALREHGQVREAAIVAQPDPRLGEVPVAAIEPVAIDAAPSSDELVGFLRERLSPQMIPVRFRFFETLPRTPSMKVDRGKVKALMAEG